jgi:glycosyltransferase involved in cell wall biosynthesis
MECQVVKQLNILAPTRDPWTFNGPRCSRHAMERRNFLPMNWISKRFEATTVFNPLPPRSFDLIHAYNRIPLGRTPFIIGFESHLPRAFGLEGTSYYDYLRRMLAGPRCRAIIAISEHARRIFRRSHEGSASAEQLLDKLKLRYPSLNIPDFRDSMDDQSMEPLKIAFVGNHFGRKGGCVAVRLAEMALHRNFPLLVEIVSSLEAGGDIWTDPASRSFFDRYFALLELPNVIWHRSMDHLQVNELMRRSHLSLLTTLGDTFGFSAIESMANWTPVIATRQCALPEFIRHDENGVLLDLETTDIGEWIHLASPVRGSQRFEAIFTEEIERLAQAAFDHVVRLASEPGLLREMRRRARETAVRMFDARATDVFWDDLYESVLGQGEYRKQVQRLEV